MTGKPGKGAYTFSGLRGKRPLRYRRGSERTLISQELPSPAQRAPRRRGKTIVRFTVMAAALALNAWTAELPVIPGDSARGAKLFQSQQCVRCHAVNGVGGKVGIDLGRSVGRNYTPAQLASTMWNHAPVMWGAMNASGIQPPQLTPTDAADLFAFFYSARLFDRLGHVGRGRQAFASRQCGTCQGIEDWRAEGAPAVVRWESLADPVVLAR